MSAIHAMMNTSSSKIDFDTLPIGSFVEGGYYAGKININGVVYALIVAPK